MKTTDYFNNEEIARGVLDMFEEAERVGIINPSHAYVFSIKGNDFNLLGSGGDIYELLSEQIATSRLTVGNGDVLGCFTRGWAAPNDARTFPAEGEGIAPSEHPDRKRVILVAIVTDLMEMASAIRMNSEEVISNTENSGELAEKLKETFKLCRLVAHARNN